MAFLVVFRYSSTDATAPSRFSSASWWVDKYTWKFRHCFGASRDLNYRRVAAACTIRGGDSGNNDEAFADGGGKDEERYSRQVYTLGARAHGLIRSATVYLDGPSQSGLVYECAKNLALSGVRRLVLVTNVDTETAIVEQNFYNATLDDLGQTYQRGARSEVSTTDDAERNMDDKEVLVQYLRRLNPNVIVTSVGRHNLEHDCDETGANTTVNSVFLCVDRPYSTQVVLNRMSRSRSWPFVAVETAGVFGRAFCDFGSSFRVYDADGETPSVTPLDRVERLGCDDNDNMPLFAVHSVTGEKHDVSKGDIIEFQYRDGKLEEKQCRVKNVESPFTFTVTFASSDNEYSDPDAFVSIINQNAAYFRRVKVTQDLKFDSIDTAIEAAKTGAAVFTPSDLEKSFDANRRSALMSCFQTLSLFIERKRRLPVAADFSIFWKLAKDAWSCSDYDGGEGKKHCKAFVRVCAAKFSPLQAVFGAIGAQEVLKAISGLYFPVKQFLLYDCDEILSDHAKSRTDAKLEEVEKEYLGLRHILGNAIVEKLKKKKVFVVGAGAIGCEILKNLASMGVGTEKRGKIILTDMDTIEKSNLSRQLLFRDCDIGKFKSIAAKEAITRLNPSMRVEAHSSKVGASGSTPFDAKFWSKNVDIVLNALDNVDARLHMDGQCVSHRKALVDAGTMGPKGNVQVVVPYQSESYSSSVDPPEPSIPMCTLKNFPYTISHTIQWGRDLFDGLFERRPRQANDFLDALASSSIDELATRLVQDKGEESAIEAALELSEDVISDSMGFCDVQSVRENALMWSALLADKLFSKTPAALLIKHPLDSVDEDGEVFWSGTRRPPKVLSFVNPPQDAEQSTINSNLIEFIRNCARLRVENILGVSRNSEISSFRLEDAERACGDVIKTADDERSSEGMGSVVSQVLASLGELDPVPQRFSVIDFEKDDESNGHVAFVSAASNLRAIAFGIPPVDSMETRRVAGNIVPAMITTTAFVSALSCIELIKLVQKVDLKLHRNAFVNLALPFFAFTIPLPAEQMPGLNGKTYTLWDQLSIKESEKAATSGGITVKSLLKKIKVKVADEPSVVNIASISVGPFLLYANFLHEDDNSVLNASVWELVNDAVSSKDTFENENARDNEFTSDVILSEDYVDLAVVIEDINTGDEVELPPLRVERFKA